ncbi:MAG: hypothetical protein CEN89_35 [Candidatus Berkelbacteria bacterium Licking1014_7]|uniref:Uncharacterized protein n=1 Tax=Candidatus Berkelbacteria bacterium Licking1014_7 TaxID=2017147 RepID=A0A554LKV1_9BACT|nr:MAG: hypothetical protein CEN89_35 [Candidatus Berkelbacteria bacterium Licking1014_7]
MQKTQTIENPQTNWEGWVAYLASAINALVEENEGRFSAIEAENSELREEIAELKGRPELTKEAHDRLHREHSREMREKRETEESAPTHPASDPALPQPSTAIEAPPLPEYLQ